MTLAKWLGDSHILTPRKSLQDQYYNDFSDDVVVMKGKSGYPCIPRFNQFPSRPSPMGFPDQDENKKEYARTVKHLQKRIPIFQNPKVACDSGPCSSNNDIKRMCTKKAKDSNALRPCPYDVAKEVALNHPHVVHNVHSFFFQNYFGEGFGTAKLMVIDEAHDLEGIVRDFIKTVFKIPYKFVSKMGRPRKTDSIEVWSDWFLDGFNLTWKDIDMNLEENPTLPNSVNLTNAFKKVFSDRNEWCIREFVGGQEVEKPTFQQRFALAFVKLVDVYSELDSDQYIVSEEDNKDKDRWEFTFTPVTLMGRPNTMFLNYGEKRLLMSGTIYDRNMFCTNLGLDPDKVSFLRIDSEFPAKRRPIYAYSDLMTDNSYSSWNDEKSTFPQMIENIRKILSNYSDVRGLIHAPSYTAMHDIALALDDERIITHRPDDFLSVLDAFTCDTDNNTVLISPVCQQGVDFKYDIARFQIILRVPYLNTSDDFVDYMRKTKFQWYNYQSLVIFGQQIGRVMRSEDDWGHTYLLDERFNRYLKSNGRLLPVG